MGRVHVSLVFLLVLILTFATALCGQESAAIKGSVRTNEIAAANVEIVIIREEDCKCEKCPDTKKCDCCPDQRVVRSNDRGDFEVKVQAGTYVVQAKARNSNRVRIQLSKGETKSVVIKLDNGEQP